MLGMFPTSFLKEANMNCEKYCCESISLVENYWKARKDDFKSWVCHHRNEIIKLPNGEYKITTRKELIARNEYYNRPSNELIFMTISEHLRLHNKLTKKTKEHLRNISKALTGRKLSAEHIKKISETQKGKESINRNRVRSEFGNKFFEHFGFHKFGHEDLYNKECTWFHKHNHKCRWEV